MSEVVVSVIVICYQPVWEKFRATLKSILLQEDVKFEIIVADDGSEKNFFEKVQDLFDFFCFKDYRFIENRTNKGTVSNINSALCSVSGKYIKVISPGDFFYQKDTLKKIVLFMERNDLQASFGDCAFYNVENGGLRVHRVQNSPRKPYLFDLKRYRRKEVMDEYLLMGYNIIGASFFAEAEVFRKYLQRIVGKVTYLEDYMYKLMVVDGIQLIHQPEITIWYEYAVGITVSKDAAKQKRMQDDAYGAFQLVRDALSDKGWYEKRLKLYFKHIESSLLRKAIKGVLFPIRSLKGRFNQEIVYTPVDGVDTQFYENVCCD